VAIIAAVRIFIGAFLVWLVPPFGGGMCPPI
jgi:hypothetical protein